MRYLQLPCEVGEKEEAELDQHLRNFRDNFSVKTAVCSTELTQDGKPLYILINTLFISISIVNLLKLLNWKENRKNLFDILSRVKDINGNEITKVLFVFMLCCQWIITCFLVFTKYIWCFICYPWVSWRWWTWTFSFWSFGMSPLPVCLSVST